MWKTGHLGANCTDIKINEPKFPGKWAENKKTSNPLILDPKDFPTLSNSIGNNNNHQKVDKAKTKSNTPPSSPKPINIEITIADISTEKEPNGNYAESVEEPNRFFSFGTDSFDFSLPMPIPNMEMEQEQNLLDTNKANHPILKDIESEDDADSTSITSSVSDNIGGNKRKSNRNQTRRSKELKTTELSQPNEPKRNKCRQQRAKLNK